jgi:hypothetical protein
MYFLPETRGLGIGAKWWQPVCKVQRFLGEMLFRNDAVYAWCSKNYTKKGFEYICSPGKHRPLSEPYLMLKNLWFCCVSTEPRLDKTIINQNPK